MAQRSYVEKDYTRDTAYIEDRITSDGSSDWPVEPGRYRLVVSRACPWANRTVIVRRLLGLEDVISLGMPKAYGIIVGAFFGLVVISLKRRIEAAAR